MLPIEVQTNMCMLPRYIAKQQDRIRIHVRYTNTEGVSNSSTHRSRVEIGFPANTQEH